MFKEGRMIGLGLAYVDGKIYSSELHLPREAHNLPEFLDTYPEASLYPGGSIPNILTSLVMLSGNPNIKLLSCVGDDPRGKFYSQTLDRHLGQPQVSPKNPTGLWVGVYHSGIVEHMEFFGASIDIVVSKRELQASRNNVLITDIDTCTIPQTRDQIIQTLEVVEDDGIFILSLGGANKRDHINQSLSSLARPPEIVFGTASELSHITDQSNYEDSIHTVFPTSRLVVITQGEKGAMIRFGGQVFSVPARYLPREIIVDETGAGDCYMGTMLALLSGIRYRDWNTNDVIDAARIASYASSLIIQTAQSRLTPGMAQLILDYVSNYSNR